MTHIDCFEQFTNQASGICLHIGLRTGIRQFAMDREIQKAVLKKAGSILSRRAYSRGELRNKLLKIAKEQQVETALNRLEQLNLLNDADYAYNFALYRITQEGWGPAKIYDSLLRRQVPHATIDAALERVCNEVDEESALVDYVKRHCSKKGPPTDPKGIRKLVMHLHLRGFDEDIIHRALDRIIPAMVLQRFETGE
jgi:regulatory protein